MLSEVDEIILSAVEEVNKYHQTYLSSEHLLLAILKHTTFPITKLLNSYGMNYRNVRMDVKQMQKNSDVCDDEKIYSDSVKRTLETCVCSVTMLTSFYMDKHSLAYVLLKRYAISIEKVMH